MKFEQMQDVMAIGAREDILDIWAWAKSNPDKDVPAADAAKWKKWRSQMEELQPRAAELWATITEMTPTSTVEDLLNGAAEFPAWHGLPWMETLTYYPWSAELAEAIDRAERWLCEPSEKVPAP